MPASGEVTMRLGDMEKRRHRFAEALAQYRKAYELDRQSPEIRSNLIQWLLRLRRYDEVASLDSDDPRSDGNLRARLAFLARGSTREMEAWLSAHRESNIVGRWN